MFATPKRHILGRNRMFWRISRQNPSTALTNTFLVRKVTRDELLHRCRGPRRNHLCRFVLQSLTGFGRGGGSNFGFQHWLPSSPLQHSRTTVRVCDIHGHNTRGSNDLQEIVFFANGKRGKQAPIPPPCPTIERVHSLRVLEIIVNAKLTAADHVDHLLRAGKNLGFLEIFFRFLGLF